MERCKICVMPSTRPDHVFVDGVCPACLNHAKRPEIDWDRRRDELLRLLDRFHGEVIVPSSGGKDSTYQAITLKNMGAHVTAVTARTCHITDIGRKNIDNLAKHVRTVEYVPDMSVRAKLNRLGLELVGDISWPEHAAIFSTPFRASLDLGIPLIMYGENPQNQYGGPKGTEQAREMTQRWVTEFGGFLGLRPDDFSDNAGITGRDMDDYRSPSANLLAENGTEAHFLGQYLPWDSQQNTQVAQEAGMIFNLPTPGNWWYAENQDNAQTGIHDFFMRLKYGYSRGTTQISVDVRNGTVPRERAMNFIENTEDMFPFMYMGVSWRKVLENIGMSEDRFIELCLEHDNGFGKANYPCRTE